MSGIHSKLGKSCSLTIRNSQKLTKTEKSENLTKTGNRVLQTVRGISDRVVGPQPIAIDSRGLGLEAQPSGIHSKLGKSCSLTIRNSQKLTKTEKKLIKTEKSCTPDGEWNK